MYTTLRNRGEAKMNPKWCPMCRSTKIVASYEPLTDYYIIGDTFRCEKCGFGFGFLMKPTPDWEKEEK